MALRATGLVQSLILLCGKIFLIISIHWLAVENSIVLASWITGGVICLFVAGDAGEFNDFARESAFISWPLISAFIASISSFFDREFNVRKLEIAARQKIFLLFTTQALLACWLQFYFVLQTWLETYPSLLADDFSRSAFAIAIETQQQSFVPPGIELLEAIDKKLAQNLASRSWDDVRQWLEKEEYHQTLQAIAKQEAETILTPSEQKLWKLEGKLLPQEPVKTLKLGATWLGPRSHPRANCYEKSCTLEPDKTGVQLTCSRATQISLTSSSSDKSGEFCSSPLSN